MIYSIGNDELYVEVCDTGAELQSIRSKKTGEEYLWQGDPAVWSGRSPLLFPVVGRLKGDAYRYRGVSYAMPKHGFARKTVFEAKRLAENSVRFVLTGEKFKDIYPFDFELEVTYALEGKTLHADYRVTNRGEDGMLFSLGAHPGLNCEMGDELFFDEDETADAYLLTGEALLLTERPAVSGIRDHRLTITKDVFAKDALIFQGLRSAKAVLTRNGAPRVAVGYGSAPCLGVWAKPGAPYVCVEPWFGVDDTESASGDLESKPYIQKLGAGCVFRFPMTIAIL